jgi:hypothetical protein
MIDLENEFWNIRRAKLEKAFAEAAMELMKHTQAGAMMLPVTGTTPQLFIMIGEAEQIVSMLPKQPNHDTSRLDAIGTCGLCLAVEDTLEAGEWTRRWICHYGEKVLKTDTIREAIDAAVLDITTDGQLPN